MIVKDMSQVLVVDDVSTGRGILLQALDALGISDVSYFGNGKEGMLPARRLPPHLVLSDRYMPGQKGLQLRQGLRVGRRIQKIGLSS